MRYIYLLVVVTYSILGYAQSADNLIPNPGFEGTRSPRNKDYSFGGGGASKFKDDLHHWESVKGSADWHDNNPGSANQAFSQFNTSDGSGINCLSAHGNTFASVGGSEAIAVKLKQTLVKDKQYAFVVTTFDRNKGDVAEVHLSDRMNFDGVLATTQENAVTINRILEASEQCMQVFRGVITVTESDMDHIVLVPAAGAFVSFDNVQLYEYCQDMIHETSNIYNHPGTFLEAKWIQAGIIYGSQTGHNFPVIINPEAGLTQYKAQEAIILRKGFLANTGTHFRAYIAPCGLECQPPRVDDTEEYVSVNKHLNYCNLTSSTPCKTFGGTTRQGMTYTWTCSDNAGMQYLSSSTSYPIQFCPANLTGDGYFKYTVTATNACGETATDDYFVYYGNNHGDAPAIGSIISSFSNLNTVPGSHFFNFNHSSNLYKVEWRVYENGSPTVTKGQQTFYTYDNFTPSILGSSDILVDPENLVGLSGIVSYCHEYKFYFTCTSQVVTRTLCN